MKSGYPLEDNHKILPDELHLHPSLPTGAGRSRAYGSKSVGIWGKNGINDLIIPQTPSPYRMMVG
jgi:hypothetical protein